jgi:hypothetical protein
MAEAVSSPAGAAAEAGRGSPGPSRTPRLVSSLAVAGTIPSGVVQMWPEASTPLDFEQPMGAAEVELDVDVVFLSVPGKKPVRDRRHCDGRTVLQKFVYVARKAKVWDSKFEYGCGTDLELRRENWHGDRKVSEKPCKPFPDWSPASDGDPESEAGTWRLRVKIQGRDEYVHKVAAFCWHRRRVPPGLDWPAFRDGYEGDHLPFVDAAGQLQTRPEWVVAGWVEAVPKAVHRQRTTQLAAARKLQVSIDRVALADAAPPPDPALLDVIERARSYSGCFWSTLINDVDTEPDVGLDESEYPAPNILTPEEKGIGLHRDYRSAAVAEVLGNPYVRLTLRRQPPGREARRHLDSYLCCVALQLKGVDVPGVPKLLTRC